MMNRLYFSLVLLLSIASSPVHAMVQNNASQNGGPMNAEWFYDENNPYKSANDLLQNQQWGLAAEEYRKLLAEKVGTEYDQDMAALNCASCLMALEKPSMQWGAYDALSGIPKEKRLTNDLLNSNFKGSVLVKTDKVGIGDIVHFIETLAELKDRTNAQVTLSIRPFLKWAFKKFAEDTGITLISEKDAQPDTDYVTHIIGLYGHLNLYPGGLCPSGMFFTAPEEAMGKIRDLLEPKLTGWNSGNTVAAVFLGENRQATLIGGKQLPRDMTKHGRQLDSQPFMRLLEKHKKGQLYLLDCGTKDSKLVVDPEFKDLVLDIPADNGFDTFIALGRFMSMVKRVVAIAADQGPANVFARSLDDEAQNRMAFIIPNSKEHDMRMNGEGAQYEQMLSFCRVYRCDTPADQETVIAQAYADMAQE